MDNLNYLGDFSLHGVTALTLEQPKTTGDYEVARVVVTMGNTKLNITLFSDQGRIEVDYE